MSAHYELLRLIGANLGRLLAALRHGEPETVQRWRVETGAGGDEEPVPLRIDGEMVEPPLDARQANGLDELERGVRP